MSAAPRRLLLVFVDGVGIGPADPERNAFATARLPHLRALLGGRVPVTDALDAAGRIEAERASLVAADATLGVEGRPQSGTGQTALLTGHNAARLFGRHFGSWVPTGLRGMLARENLLSRTVAAGRGAAFANAHPPHVSLDRRPSAPALAAHAAGVLTRGAAEVREGRALASSITNERWIDALPGFGIPAATPADAARALLAIAAAADVTLFAHYDTDFVGHRESVAEARAALERVDAFLGPLVEGLPPDTLLVVASDHGNVEDASTGHTRNPVPVIAAGAGRRELAARVRSITDVTPAACRLLGIGSETGPDGNSA